MKKLIIPTIIFLIASILLIFSGINVIFWYIDNQEISSSVEYVQNITPIDVITVTDEEKEEKKDYITADLTQIKQINSEVVGWLNIPYTKVNYPVLKHKDNAYYLNHSFDKSKNKAGWIFMDYRSNPTNLDKNTVIYGHNRLDGSMFGSLNKLTEKGYLNANEHLIYLSTEKYNYVFEIFSIYRIDTTDDYLQMSFKDNEYINWLTTLKERSIHDFAIEVTKNDKIITLSTCYKHVKKLVVHAKLIRMQER